MDAARQMVIVGLVVIAALAVGIGIGIVMTRHRHGSGTAGSPGHDDAEAPPPQPPRELVAFVANPSKPEVTALEEAIRRIFAQAALPDPLWLETTVEDPGTGQTKTAIEQGADVVVAVGGDGTVRAVAQALVGTGRTMGLIPVGTGNLLARNLDLPVGDPMSALNIVIGGSDRPIDVGWIRVTEWGQGEAASEADHVPRGSDDATHIFLVIAGLGFDAAMVANTDDALKAKVGWVAYFLGGIRHLHGHRIRARITLDDRDPVEARLRTLMIGNCGRLPGGITLLPDALIDDGILDIAAVDTRGGLMGWAQLFGEVVMQGFGIRNDLPAKIGRIDHTRARRVCIQVDTDEQAQVDGDVLGAARALDAWVDPEALVVRTA